MKLNSPNVSNLNISQNIEELVVNKSYFNTLQDILTCIICNGLLVNPIACAKCETVYCFNCISTWIERNNQCHRDAQENLL